MLKLLHAFLRQDDTILSANGVIKIECEYAVNENIFKTSLSSLNGAYDWSEFKNSPLSESKSLFLGVERGVSNQASKIEPHLIYEFFSHPRYQRYFSNKERNPANRESSNIMARELSEELALYLRRRQSMNPYAKKQAIDVSANHAHFSEIKIDNIRDMLVERYRIAKIALTVRIQAALFDTLSLVLKDDYGPQKTPMDFLAKLKENKQKIIDALEFGPENQFKSSLIEKLNSIDSEDNYEKITNNSMLTALVSNMIKELDNEQIFLGSINLTQDLFNNYITDGKLLQINEEDAVIRLKNKQTHSANDLSSGERHILTLLSLVVFEGPKRDFLIIDEPEISLNTKWQRRLIRDLIIAAPTTQIIVASHSPQIVSGVNSRLVKIEVQ
jgi:ABC-type lipoprotein export system ATPase subunit